MSSHVPTQREIIKNIRADGRLAPASDEEKLRDMIQTQYDDLQSRFAHAIMQTDNRHVPAVIRNIRETNLGLWQLCTTMWKFRWVLSRHMLYKISYGISGFPFTGILTLFLQLLNDYLLFWIGAIISWRAYKQVRGNPKLTRSEIAVLKITITCMEWLRKLYELPITFSEAIWRAVRGHWFTPSDIDAFHLTLQTKDLARSRQRRNQKLNVVMGRN
jgi:hypothetical protein